MKKIFTLAFSCILLGSCTNNPEKAISKMEAENHEQIEAVELAEVIELNAGNKWVVNEEMKPYVIQGSALVDNYLKAEFSDHKILAAELKAENEKLIKSCTMTGKSHEELHKWLKPHLGLVKDLENASDGKQAKALALELQESYLRYHKYFQ